MDKEKKDITFYYEKGTGYKMDYVNGLYGGVTTNEQIHINFFMEQLPVPSKIVYTEGEDGNYTMEGDPSSESTVYRELKSGIIIDLEVAYSMIDWLMERVTILEEMQKVKEDEEE